MLSSPLASPVVPKDVHFRGFVDYLCRPESFATLESLTHRTLAQASDSKREIKPDNHDLLPKIETTRQVKQLAPAVFRDVQELLELDRVPRDPLIFTNPEDSIRLPLLNASSHATLAGVAGAMATYFYFLANPLPDKTAATAALMMGGIMVVGVGCGAFINYFARMTMDPSTTGSYQRFPTPIIIVHVTRTAYYQGYKEVYETPVVVRKRDVEHTLAHEYAHHLQKAHLFRKLWKNKPLLEGHARAVERAYSTRQADQNPSSRSLQIENDAVAMERIYTSLCLLLEKERNPEIMRLNEEVFRENYDFYYKYALGMTYELGNCAFLVAEEQHGAQVLRDTLKNDLSVFGIT